MEMTDIAPEQELPQEILDEIIDEEADRFSAPRRLRPEAVMSILAVLAAVILVLTAVVCIPYITADRTPEETQPAAVRPEEPTAPEDPEIIRHQNHQAEAEPLPTIEPIIEPEANPYGPLDFQYNKNNYLYCLRQDSYPGVDVSAFQRDIDWQ